MTDHPDPTDGCPLITRRQFVAGLGATATVTTVAGFSIGIWAGRDDIGSEPAVPRSPLAYGVLGQGADRTLVVIEMGGGNDSLNTVVPHAAPAYFDLRGDLAVQDAIDLDGDIGLHPNLQWVADRYGKGQVAIVEGVGYPEPDLSHFLSMAVWWAADPKSLGIATGWLGRYLDGTIGADNPLAAVVIGPGPTPALLADHSFAVTIQDETGLSPRIAPWMDSADELMASWAGFAPADGVDSPGLFGQVQSAIAASVAAAGRLDVALETASPGYAALGDSMNGDSMTESMGGDDMEVPARPDSRSLSGKLDLAARLVASDSPPRVIYVHGFNDFDTHEAQAGTHTNLMAQLDEGLELFYANVEALGVAERALVMTTSEFGRRAAANGSGTDHGTAASHFLIGNDIAGGRYGESPSLTGLDPSGNLIHTVDFRSVFATVLDGWFDVDHRAVLGSSYETLPLLRT